MSVEALKSFFDVGAVVLLFLAFAFGAGVLITGNIINDRQAAQLRQFDKELRDKDVKIAEAQRGATEAGTKAEGFRLNIAKANEAAGEARERAASLEVEALKLRKHLVLQGSRENLLSRDNRRKLVDALKRFAGQKVDVGYSANVLMINDSVVTATPLGDDTVGLANALVGVMKDAGWYLPPTALLYAVQGYGINVEIVEAASLSTRAAAEALARALRGASLVVFGPQVVSTDHAQRVGAAAQALSPPLDETTIILCVLTHPK
jgi:hypothetical protein